MLTYTLNLDSKERCSELPQDTIPVSAIKGNYFFLHHDLIISPPSPIQITSFKQYINTLSQWKRNLNSNYEESTTKSSFAETIQMKQKIHHSIWWNQVKVYIRRGVVNSKYKGRNVRRRNQPWFRSHQPNPFTPSGNIWCLISLYLHQGILQLFHATILISDRISWR